MTYIWIRQPSNEQNREYQRRTQKDAPKPWEKLSRCVQSVYLVPPFSRATGIQPSTRASLPHSAHCEDYRLLEPKRSVYTYLETDLQTPRLNAVHGKLWLAGLPRPARPLHRQRRLLRHIQITEYPDEHLVWHDAYICIKPLPEYLFDYEFWEEELCKTEALHKAHTASFYLTPGSSVGKVTSG